MTPQQLLQWTTLLSQLAGIVASVRQFNMELEADGSVPDGTWNRIMASFEAEAALWFERAKLADEQQQS